MWEALWNKLMPSLALLYRNLPVKTHTWTSKSVRLHRNYGHNSSHYVRWFLFYTRRHKQATGDPKTQHCLACCGWPTFLYTVRAREWVPLLPISRMLDKRLLHNLKISLLYLDTKIRTVRKITNLPRWEEAGSQWCFTNWHCGGRTNLNL
jgi:hypothetical protein